MYADRIFNSDSYFQPSDVEPLRSVITETKEAVVVAWFINPGQKIRTHIHPNGQDTWTVLAGKGEYYLDQHNTTQQIHKGDVVITPVGYAHGVFNNGAEPLLIISVVSPADAGYQLI